MIFKIIYYETTPKGHLEDARVHCVVLKVRAVPSPHTSKTAGARKGPELQIKRSGPSGPNSVHAPPTHPDRSSCKQRTEPGLTEMEPRQMFHP